jgi:hypothetical protein
MSDILKQNSDLNQIGPNLGRLAQDNIPLVISQAMVSQGNGTHENQEQRLQALKLEHQKLIFRQLLLPVLAPAVCQQFINSNLTTMSFANEEQKVKIYILQDKIINLVKAIFDIKEISDFSERFKLRLFNNQPISSKYTVDEIDALSILTEYKFMNPNDLSSAKLAFVRSKVFVLRGMVKNNPPLIELINQIYLCSEEFASLVGVDILDPELISAGTPVIYR